MDRNIRRILYSELYIIQRTKIQPLFLVQWLPVLTLTYSSLLVFYNNNSTNTHKCKYQNIANKQLNQTRKSVMFMLNMLVEIDVEGAMGAIYE